MKLIELVFKHKKETIAITKMAQSENLNAEFINKCDIVIYYRNDTNFDNSIRIEFKHVKELLELLKLINDYLEGKKKIDERKIIDLGKK
ncbi:MAG TPA: hypothetical protein ENG63_09755 [Candidatus Desulfofervidus auxilii]|uniref:Uncharacterized protein n=1 Tax=Desulfofervidus auxilii TaxID=1621989 RepID=A0A7C0U4D5_DESA2|nr:hypothetical protein [Candidatus Desulfofervidus auxilii]